MKLKKLILPMMLFLTLIPFIVKAETCDANKITIDSVAIKQKTDQVTEIDEPVIDGKTIKVNLKMLKVNDLIEYKLLLKNESSEDYELDKNSFDDASDYIDYSLNTDDNSLIVKAGKTKEVYLKVQYKNEVPSTAYTDGKYNDNKNFVLNLSNSVTNDETDTIVNPKTGQTSFILILILIICLSVAMYFLISQKKYSKLMIVLLGVMILIPTSIYALCKVEINIESNVEIEKASDTTPEEPEVTKYEVGYLLNGGEVLYTDAEASKYAKTDDSICHIVYIGSTKYNYCSNLIQKDTTTYEAGTTVNLKTINVKYLDFDYTTCELQSDNSYLCPSESDIVEYTITDWNYDNLWNMYGYTYSNDDKDVMNFSEYIFDNWASDGYFVVTAPTTFKMPAHSALFALNHRGK